MGGPRQGEAAEVDARRSQAGFLDRGSSGEELRFRPRRDENGPKDRPIIYLLWAFLNL